MAQPQPKLDGRRSPAPQAQAPARPHEHGFKPVALPALAAAVRASTQGQVRKPAAKDIPAFLRGDAFFG